MIRKSLYYRYKYKGKERKKIFSKILFLVFVIVVSYSIVHILPTIKDFLKIKELEILFNNTTLPNYLIKDFFVNNKTYIFNFRKISKDFFNTYNEVEEIKTNFFPLKKLKLKIKSKIPMFYTIDADKHIFISAKGEMFVVYDKNKIDFNRIVEIKFQTNFDISKLVYLYNFLLVKNLISEVQKIEIKDNNEYLLYFVNGNKIILDYEFDKIKPDILFDVIIFVFNKKIDVYARLLNEGVVYIK